MSWSIPIDEGQNATAWIICLGDSDVAAIPRKFELFGGQAKAD
jgi:hypothetical protein